MLCSCGVFLLLRSRSANRPVIIWDVDGQRGTLKAELDAPPVRGFVRNYFAAKKFIPTGRRHRFFLTPPAAGIPNLSGGCDAQGVDHCAHTDAVARRLCRPRANCAATNSVTTNAITRRACAGS